MSTDDNKTSQDPFDPIADQPNDEADTRKTAKAKKKDELVTLKEQCAEYLGGWQRARADYDNLQRETTRRIGETIRHANEEFILELLPMADYFSYAFKGVPEEDRGSDWLTGIEHIQTNFMRIMESHGVTPIETVGQPFDPHVHEALEEVAGGESGIIAEEVAAGFKLNDKVIRIAKVKIYK